MDIKIKFILIKSTNNHRIVQTIQINRCNNTNKISLMIQRNQIKIMKKSKKKRRKNNTMKDI